MATCVWASNTGSAAAFDPIKPICDVAGLLSGIVGKVCSVVQGGGSRVLGAGQKLLGGHLGSAFKALLGATGGAARSGATTALGLAAIGVWVVGGAKLALHEIGKFLAETTTPQLTSSWFSATYWRVAAIAALLTLPFLFAAAIQAVVRSDLALLLRATLGYLPLALIGVSIAAPLAMLLLSGADELSALVSSAAGEPGAHALDFGVALGGALSTFARSPFLVFFLALLTAAGAVFLWIELLMREAAVYVVVLMLPLAFAALVWPAKRIWAIRAAELLVALILSKFAIVAILALGGAAVNQAFGGSATAPIVGVVLVMMAAFAPWVLLRLVPLGEMASAAAGSLRGDAAAAIGHGRTPWALGHSAHDWARATTSEMRRAAEDAAEPAALPGSGRPGAREQDGVVPEAADNPSHPAENGGVDQNGGVDLQASDNGAVPPDSDPEGGPGPPKRGHPLADIHPMWDAPNFSWPPIILGPEGIGPPPPWPPNETDGGSGQVASEEDRTLPSPGQDPAPNGDEPHPLPGEQEPPLPPNDAEPPLPPGGRE